MESELELDFDSELVDEEESDLLSLFVSDLPESDLFESVLLLEAEPDLRLSVT